MRLDVRAMAISLALIWGILAMLLTGMVHVFQPA
jgi:hypothetical protein